MDAPKQPEEIKKKWLRLVPQPGTEFVHDGDLHELHEYTEHGASITQYIKSAAAPPKEGDVHAAQKKRTLRHDGLSDCVNPTYPPPRVSACVPQQGNKRIEKRGVLSARGVSKELSLGGALQ